MTVSAEADVRTTVDTAQLQGANPFNVIVGSQLVLQEGDPVPTGKLDAIVHIVAHASF